MKKIKTLNRFLLSLLVIALLMLPSVLNLIFRSEIASAAQLTTRKITIGSSKAGATDTTYSVSFNTPSGGTIKGIVVQFCNSATGPLIGTACTGPTGFDLNLVNLVVANQRINGSAVANPYTIHANSTTNTLILTNATGNAAAATNSVTFDLGTNAGANDGVTNPSTTGTFYARILIYSNNATAAAYTATVPGSHIDDGGIALSTANQLSTNARVQEILQFCVGSTTVDDATSLIANDCSNSFTGSCGTVVDLGVLDTSAVSISPVPTAAGNPGSGNACNGATMVRTNASNGVVITYFAEQDTNSGKLKVPGATCSGSSNTDQCFNDSTTQAAFTAGTEKFGVTVGGINPAGTTSYTCTYANNPNNCALEPSAGYLGQGGVGTEAYGTGNGFAWDDNGFTTPDQLASSTGPVDDEAMVLKFAATPAITTPTGSYTVTSTYIATSTF